MYAGTGSGEGQQFLGMKRHDLTYSQLIEFNIFGV
jgi:hypothetical protein